VSNPVYSGLEPSLLYDRATGYGIVRLNKETRKITIECWPRQADPALPDAHQYSGWPITVHQYADVLKGAPYSLPQFQFADFRDPVITVSEEKSGDLVYALRVAGDSFTPKVFEKGNYRIRVSIPETGSSMLYPDLTAKASGDDRVLVVRLK
jgi:alkaline phosphatase D